MKVKSWMAAFAAVFVMVCVGAQAWSAETKEPRVVYPKKTKLDFEGMGIEGEIQSPGEFYYQHRPEEKFDSLLKVRKNFHREMLRDAMLSK